MPWLHHTWLCSAEFWDSICAYLGIVLLYPQNNLQIVAN